MATLKDTLLGAPDSQLDACMKPLIAKWSDPPSALQLLEVIDHCINGALASGFTLSYLQTLYDQQLKAEGLVHDDLLKDATWRKDHI